MGELKMYQPTKGMAAADRTKEGYAAVIKEWVQSIEDVFTPFYTVSEIENGINFVPIDERINFFNFQLYAYDSGATTADHLKIRLWAKYLANGNGETANMNANEDPKIYVWSADDGCGMGVVNAPIYSGVMCTTDYDGVEQPVVIINQSSLNTVSNCFRIGESNGVEAAGAYTSIVNRYQKKSANFCVKPHTCYDHGLINNHLYYLDGGMVLPSARTIFTLNDELYTMVQGNTCFKF